MKTSKSARILPFPDRNTAGQVQQAVVPVFEDMDPMLQGELYDDGGLIEDASFFDIDEPDPLLITEGRNADFTPRPRADLGVVEGREPHGKQRFLRLRDLHPIDIAIVAGFLVLVSLL